MIAHLSTIIHSSNTHLSYSLISPMKKNRKAISIMLLLNVHLRIDFVEFNKRFFMWLWVQNMEFSIHGNKTLSDKTNNTYTNEICPLLGYQCTRFVSLPKIIFFFQFSVCQYRVVSLTSASSPLLTNSFGLRPFRLQTSDCKIKVSLYHYCQPNQILWL